MKQALVRALLAAFLPFWLTAAAWAGFDEGRAAYERGDYATAHEELRPLAEAGNAAAQTLLGTMLYFGRGVPEDYAEAAKWYHKAAEQEFATAQYGLGVLYLRGDGVPHDYILAHMWFELAELGGIEVAGEDREETAKRMVPAAIAVAQRLAREWLEAHGQ